MTWEMPDKTWKRFLSPTLIFSATALILVFKFFTGGQPTEASYESSCTEQGGEWLQNATKPTCVFKGGRLVVLDAVPPPFQGGGQEGVVPSPTPTPSPIPTITPSDFWTTPASDPAPECGYGKLGEFADYPATEFYKGRPHKPDFSTWPDAAKYRTAITKDVARGVNFGGAYVVARWGMPSDDAQHQEGFAIVNARTGQILTYWTGVYKIDFKPSSRFYRIFTPSGPFAEIISDNKEVSCGQY